MVMVQTKVFQAGVVGLKAMLSQPSDCHVVAFNANTVKNSKKLSPLLEFVNELTQGALSLAVMSGDFNPKPGSVLMLRANDAWYKAGIKSNRLILVGVGDDTGEKSQAQHKKPTKYVETVLDLLVSTKAIQVHWFFEELPLRDGLAQIRLLVQNARTRVYRFGSRFIQHKTTVGGEVPELKKIILATDKRSDASIKKVVAEGLAIAEGMDLCKDLGNLPPNLCNPTYLAQEARKLGKEFGMKIEVLNRRQLEQLKMGAFLAVTQGSETPPQFIVIHHHGAAGKDAPVVLVGKGITFDTGGISLKPGEGMDEMKYDMCGAASVMGTMKAIAKLKLKRNVIGVIPTCENMPSGQATRPGDIVTSMSGQTIEILNTDAEGRLILCDALTYVERFNPAAVIDIATLTGACVIALGAVHSGLFTEDDALAESLLSAGRVSQDTAWRMPLDAAYQEQLKSNFADMANIGGRPAGSVTAACFLARFTEKYTWAHLDIAGTAWKSGAQKGATGRPVPMLVNYLLSQ